MDSPASQDGIDVRKFCREKLHRYKNPAIPTQGISEHTIASGSGITPKRCQNSKRRNRGIQILVQKKNACPAPRRGFHGIHRKKWLARRTPTGDILLRRQMLIQ